MDDNGGVEVLRDVLATADTNGDGASAVCLCVCVLCVYVCLCVCVCVETRVVSVYVMSRHRRAVWILRCRVD